MAELDALDRRLIDAFQRDLPLCPRPFAVMAERLGVSEAEVLARLHALQQDEVLSRVGPVFDHARAGASLLAAVSVPEAERDAVATAINRSPGVNHNYAREHDFNLWFVMTAADENQLEARLEALEEELGRPLLRLPMVEGYHIDLGFPIPWDELEAP
ncbi:Lrp/AsnC family transcriptional regulator [Halomonas sp. MCCC 1A17488]|uniref:siroheme decarboxylase n=2 Tax=Oceanospirillales TaxID=135619 RepID=A0ABX7WA18_9GAMM|nr:Lrp/AsnC family transcriptional regulator [Halomonas sp. MCCC 1A17488]MCG3240350.1 Lrp/AsnC family transcriptional regulator [Halomonas sp. MCCC 1A17488]QPP51472.1 Lrp/AsnC family transcriptional regulator [Halomonas sp. SS10-MC5]QTP56930.1 Lrp/AsnC family transcriptional regulator [Halomonas sulfidoxydans]